MRPFYCRIKKSNVIVNMESEQKALRKAQKQMDAIYLQAMTLPEGKDVVDWEPEVQPDAVIRAQEWKATLARIDMLADRLSK